MAAVIRLKRRLNEEPLNALICKCKRRKTSEIDKVDQDNHISTVLKFVGTIQNQEEDFSEHISKTFKSNLEECYKRHIPDVSAKVKQQTKESSQKNRFKIVNLYRSQDTKKEIDKSDNKITVLDIEVTDKKDELNEQYVYDLYYTNSEGFEDNELENFLSICPADELVYGLYQDNGKLSDESDHETDDSNDENNWRNDYPDEDENSINEEDMREAMERLSFAENLSDDDGEEGFVYSIDSEGAGFEEELDHSDVRRYGELYARFKAKQKQAEERYNKDIYDDIESDDEYSD